MPFAYYARLSRKDQATYRKSDAIRALPVPGAEALHPAVEALRAALAAGEGRKVALASFEICSGVCRALGVKTPQLRVLAVRPREAWGELHGLYTPGERGGATIRVWMRTARHARPVAFRTYLRTLLHELLHHLDLEALGLEWSFHTEGFFARESSLFRQLAPGEAPRRPRQLPLEPGPAGRG